MKYKVGDKVKVVQFTETYLDAPEKTIGNIGTVDNMNSLSGNLFLNVFRKKDINEE